MATLATTPQKPREIDCFSCFQEDSRSFKLTGRKLQTEGFCNKLRSLLQNDSVYESLLKNRNSAICRNCHSKVINTEEFISKLRNSTASYLSGCVSLKRGALSPSTPKSSNLTVTAVIREKSRKQLKLSDISSTTVITSTPGISNVISTPVSTPVSTPLSSNLECMLEHGYAMKKAVKDDCVSDPCMEKITETYNSLLFVPQSKNQATKFSMLSDLRGQSATLTSRTTMFASVLFKYRGITDLVDNAGNLLQDIIHEMSERVPLLLEVMCCVAVPASGKITPQLISTLASCYSILMKHKFHNLSAYHRLTSIIVTKGGLDDRGQSRLNHLGLVLSSERRLKLQESAGETSQKLIIDHLKSNPLIKVTGDNLDIYVKTSHMTSERKNRDLHLFTSNVIFSRVATIDMSNDSPKTDPSNLSAENVLLSRNELQKEKLVHVYSILLQRTLCQLPAFVQYRKLFPEHIPHEFSQKMSTKSMVYPLPIQFKNEAKHEDCLAIMDSYEEQLTKLYTGAFGNVDFLRKYKVPVGGDQLTRVRLSEAKNLRTLSVTPEKKFEDLHPIVCEMWHSKQDFLAKCFKTFYKAENSPGTLYFFKTILHRSNVNGKVKGRFQPHFDLLMAVGEGLITEQFMEFFQMEDKQSQPKHPQVIDIKEKTLSEQKDLILSVMNEFVQKYGYGMIDTPDKIRKLNENPPKLVRKYKAVIADTKQIVLQSYLEAEKVTVPEEDELYNYCVQLCHWYLHIAEMHDTAKEGDMNRAVLNSKYAVPFFYSHSKLSKYMVENIDYVLKTEYLLSPLQRARVLEGSFVNIRGGKGHNVESDLVQEHSVCNQKSLIKTLGANKSEKSISRVTSSADTIADICSQFDNSIQLKPKSARHSKAVSPLDQETIYKQLRKIRPFQLTPGRKCKGFAHIKSVPVSENDIPAMIERINKVVFRLTRGLVVGVDEENVDLNNEIEENLPVV